MKIDIRIVYGKSELQPAEVNWLKNLHYIRTSYCHNLHAKCYISENACIITSLNLYEFSQVNNNEMGIYIERDDGLPCQDAYAEAQRIIRISDEVKITLDVIEKTENGQTAATDEEPADTAYLTTSKPAERQASAAKAATANRANRSSKKKKRQWVKNTAPSPRKAAPARSSSNRKK